jgi:hypothetical protein
VMFVINVAMMKRSSSMIILPLEDGGISILYWDAAAAADVWKYRAINPYLFVSIWIDSYVENLSLLSEFSTALLDRHQNLFTHKQT